MATATTVSFDKRLLTPAEVARMLGVSPNTVTRWTREGRLPFRVTLGGHRRFDPDVVREFQDKPRALARGSFPSGQGWDLGS